MLDVVIVGGGAAGFFAAANLRHAGRPLRVCILEAGKQVLAKVKISGGGRCNVTHQAFEVAQLVQHYPRGSKELRSAFSRFQPRDMIEWLRARGVQTKVEADGRVFPVSDDSQTIVDCLRRECELSGVLIRTGAKVVRIEPLGASEGFRLTLADETQVEARQLVLATGGSRQVFPLITALGHTVVEPVPSLFTLNVQDPRLEGLAGIAFQKVSVTLDGMAQSCKQDGPLLITHWGLSGPVILRLSAWEARALHGCDYRGSVRVHFAPGKCESEVGAELKGLFHANAAKSLHTVSIPWWPKRYWQRLVELHFPEGQRCSQISRHQLMHLAALSCSSKFGFEGKSTHKDEFVTAGGVALKEVDFRSMESKQVPGLFFAGEVLDVDGVTGGFNFQAAWTTAYLCAQTMLSRLAEGDRR